MKALEKNRDRRYQTANGFAKDIERYLNDEAVQACPPSARYRLRKFARKYRMPLAVTAGFVLVLVAATVVSSRQALRAARAGEAANAAATKATTISQLLQEMLNSANPDTLNGPNYTVRQLLDDASARLGDQLKD